jgi:hypothetical protein
VLCVEGEGVTLIADHAVNSFCNMLHRVFLYCLRVITCPMCITYFRDVYMFTLTILRVGNGYLIENRVLPKKNSRTV